MEENKEQSSDSENTKETQTFIDSVEQVEAFVRLLDY
jgi:hypothetical protein